jgi:hypothetical protein
MASGLNKYLLTLINLTACCVHLNTFFFLSEKGSLCFIGLSKGSLAQKKD